MRTQPPLPRCARACLHALGAATAIAAIFPKVVKPVEGESLVIQYSVKLEKAHNCGGMCARLACLAAPLRSQRRSGCISSRRYIKLLKDDPDLADGLDEFDGDTEYTIMFGPDKCGGTDKVRAHAATWRAAQESRRSLLRCLS